jgi:predicted ATPase
MRRTNIPKEASLFVGRAGDLAGLSSGVAAGPLVTITGPGGIGKTTLALRVAAELTPSFTSHRGGGSWFCDLSEAREQTDLVAAVAATLGLTLEEGARDDEVVRALGRAIARRGRILLVLDNFDRLTQLAEATLVPWLRVAPGAHFLITSRLALDLPDEQRWPLSPLSREEGRDLFLARARRVDPSLRLHDGEHHVIHEIVDAVDGIPLAIELAASRVAVLSPFELRERLKSSHDVLERKSGGRQSSMRATVKDSLSLLPPGVLEVFAACGGLRNGFTLEAAEDIFLQVVPEPHAVLQSLDALVRHSLLSSARPSATSGIRYSFYSAIREVAEEMFTDPSRESLRSGVEERHLAYYARLARRFRDVGRQALHRHAEALGDALDNLLLAHARGLARAGNGSAANASCVADIALGLEPLLSARGRLHMRVALLSGAMASLTPHLSQGDAFVRPFLEITLFRGAAHKDLGELPAAREDFERALEMCRAHGEQDLAAVALTRLGEMNDMLGDTERARVLFAEALHLLGSEQGKPEARTARKAEALLGLGHALRREGDLENARLAIDSAIADFRSLGDAERLASALYEAAVVAMFSSDRARALSFFDEGLEVAREAKIPMATAGLRTARGCLLQDAGELELAVAHHAEAARIFQEVGGRYREASALYYLASAHLERGEPRDCVTTLRRAEERVAQLGFPRYEALIHGCLAAAYGELGDRVTALTELLRAESSLELVKNEPALAATVRIHRLNYEARKGTRSFAEALDEARALEHASSNDDSRFAYRVLARAQVPAAQEAAALVVHHEGAWFHVPGGKAVVLPAGSSMRRILALLARTRVESVGESSPIHEIIKAGWPSERMAAAAALNRAYVALAALRKAGLKNILLHEDGGYRLTESLPIRISNQANSPAGPV